MSSPERIPFIASERLTSANLYNKIGVWLDSFVDYDSPFGPILDFPDGIDGAPCLDRPISQSFVASGVHVHSAVPAAAEQLNVGPILAVNRTLAYYPRFIGAKPRLVPATLTITVVHEQPDQRQAPATSYTISDPASDSYYRPHAVDFIDRPISPRELSSLGQIAAALTDIQQAQNRLAREIL